MDPKKKLLITRPRHDCIVEYLHFWSNEIIQFAEKYDIRVLDCEAKDANRETVCLYLEKQSPEFVVFNGHGDQTTITGHKDEELIKSGVNEDLLKSKIIYAISCKVAARLGEDMCKKGAKAFIGYEQDFGFVTEALREGCPHKDKFSEPFKQASNAVAFSIIKGNSAGEAFKKSQRTYDELIRKYSTRDVNREDKEIRFWLFWDKFFQRMVGDDTAII